MERLAEILWGVPTMVLLLAVGVVMSLRTRFVQVRKLPAAFRQVGQSLRGDDRSGFRAVCTALAATVGTGNIAGVAGAIALGGPGAVFWMWVAAFFGMATKYAEVMLAKRYVREGRGGPMYYILFGMGHKYRFLAAVFSFSAVLASFAMGNMTQMHTVAAALQTALPAITPRVTALTTGLAAALLIGFVTVGGAKRIGQLAEKLVPVMAFVYILSMLAVIGLYWRDLGQVLSSIFLGAFAPRAILGGGAGIGVRQAVRWGVSRGVFSNEAGLGSAPIAHAGSKLSGEEQGLLGIFEVFFDTVILCSLTAFAILACPMDIVYGKAAGAELAAAAMTSVFGPWASGLCAAVLIMTAFATVISWQLYGLRCAEFLWGEGSAKAFGLCYAAAAVLGSTMELGRVWALADVCNGLMCLPNLIALLYLRREIKAD